ncbi:5NTD-like protein [Mya arenaria]|uniref:5'-nucleotidase n=1 Tax=Mya arenaria TaxID=6604 RepID=A0ABY7EC64_MYAAR|nr:5NTD-like protein [Mya arenaria]
MELKQNIYIFILTCTLTVALTFELTILHTNDVHARFDELNKYGSDCSNEDAQSGACFGGVARRHTKVKEINGSHENVLFLDAGDQFTGTPWFTVHRGQATAHFMNLLDYDVMCLGNHEFDLKPEGLAPFLGNLSLRVISANVDVSEEPLLRDKVVKSVVKTVGGEQIGIVGYTTQDTAFISRPGDTKGPSVGFDDVETAVKAEVDRLRQEGVNKIIALGHAGFQMDKRVAAISGTPPSRETPEGPYPVVVNQMDGGQALVVQAFTFGKYLGYLNVTFDVSGKVIDYAGNPILLDASVEQDAVMLSELSTWREPVIALQTRVIGSSKTLLDGQRDHCRLRECNLGNMVADGMVDYFARLDVNGSHWSPAAIAIVNSGGVRVPVPKGVLTAGDANSILPFRNEVDLVRVRGSDFRKQLEHSVEEYSPSADPSGGFLQFSGVRVRYNVNKPAGQRVVSVDVRCRDCDVPTYSPLKNDDIYSVLMSNFIIDGGDGFSFQPIDRVLDVDILTAYIENHSPVWAEEEGRITFQTADFTSSGTSGHPAAGAIAIFTVITLLMNYFH